MMIIIKKCLESCHIESQFAQLFHIVFSKILNGNNESASVCVCVCVRVGISEEPRISFFFVLNAETKIPNLKVLFGKRDNNIIITAMIIMCHHSLCMWCAQFYSGKNVVFALESLKSEPALSRCAIGSNILCEC